MRDGIRREKATSGWGSIDIELKEESVAPWKRLGCSVGCCVAGSMKEVTTATGWAVSLKRERRSSRTTPVSVNILRAVPCTFHLRKTVEQEGLNIEVRLASATGLEKVVH